MTRRPAVLIIDDDEQVASFLVRLLTAQGYDASSARSEEEAAALLSLKPADLLLVDVVLAAENGYAVAGRLSQGTPFVLLTGQFVDADMRRDAELLGAAALVAKPFDAAEVIALVGRLTSPPQ